MERKPAVVPVFGCKKLSSWDTHILSAVEKAERMSFLYQTPCNVIASAGRSLELTVRLEGLTAPNAIIVETVYPIPVK
ncbi:hypothetical protein D3C81_365250 [compost metagenome]